ncbi:unnamed protein product [Rotaria sordida]|uniref:G-protein coupled receptors family 1 profile domain-containing protein n=1 Tax=Rotaria sordida TaxID=392033 RepID=A0A819SEH0_9BILA|nr:unnamed protein product [Rotaria sordida]
MFSIATFLGIVNLCLVIIAILIFLLIFIIIFTHHEELNDISLVLTCNTCLAAFLTCITEFFMTISNLTTGFLNYNLYFCYGWGLLYDIFECSIYHSYCLQAFFRLCRVVFYKKKSLLSFSLYYILIIGQWLISIGLFIPTILLQWYIHLPTETYCLVPYTDIGASTYLIIILYLIPLVSISLIYVWITKFIRSSAHPTTLIIVAKQRQRNLRDLTIIKRIVILILILIVLRCPTIIFIIYGVIARHLYSLTYSIVGLITSAFLTIIGLITIDITPQLKKNILMFAFCRDSRVHVHQIPLRTLEPIETVQGNVIGTHPIITINERKDVNTKNKF